jgi:hypothetical protein
MKKVYIGECEHIGNYCIIDDECLKRHIHITNPKTNEIECLIFCNDYLKLNSQKKDYYNFQSQEGVLKFVETSIFEYLGLKSGWHYNNSSIISQHTFGFTISRRPFIYGYFTLNQYINWYLDNPSYDMADLIKEKITCFLDDLKYQKYKTKYKQLIALSNKITRFSTLDKVEKESIILQLISEAFKLTIKNQ